MSSRSDKDDLLKDPSELWKEGCAITLRKALAKSTKFRTIRAVSEAARVNYNTTKDYFQGRHLASRENWARIAAVFLAEIGASIPVRRKRVGAAAANRRVPAARAARVLETLRRLGEQLDFVKTGSRKDRDLLRRIVPGTDVGYITSLLRALYDEDQFEEWILFSNYPMRRADYTVSRDK